jgi:hypothetical protein
MITKICTDIDQSKKLAEILPLESADMRYHTISHYNPYPCDEIVYTVDFGKVSGIDIPCWSLAALLSVIPKHIDYNVLRIDISENDFAIWYDDSSYDEFGYGVNTELPDITMECPVDACVDMIIKLHEQKLL